MVSATSHDVCTRSQNYPKNKIGLVESIKESNLYTCGAPLFPPGSSFEKSIVLREALVCSSYIQTQYYVLVNIHCSGRYRCNRGAGPPRVTSPPGRYALGRRVPPWFRASPPQSNALRRLDDRSE